MLNFYKKNEKKTKHKKNKKVWAIQYFMTII